VAFGQALVYGTGGVAFGDVKTQYSCPTCVGAPGPFETISDMRIGWTGGAGVAYALNTNWSAGLEYRYTDLGRQSWSKASIDGHDSNEFNYNLIQLALTYRFAAPMAPPPAPAPMPAAAPAPPPPQPPRTFLVFFDFDRYNLTPDARKVIEAAAQSFKQNGSATIEVSGYTDLAGTQAYNLKLSQRRADAVANYLAKQGVAKNVLDIKWFGKEHPRVPTPDGVREPQNRRVEIVMPQ
jgi:OOP family OmpA-OmpF porin